MSKIFRALPFGLISDTDYLASIFRDVWHLDWTFKGDGEAKACREAVRDVAMCIYRQATSRIIVLATVSRKRCQVQEVSQGY